MSWTASIPFSHQNKRIIPFAHLRKMITLKATHNFNEEKVLKDWQTFPYTQCLHWKLCTSISVSSISLSLPPTTKGTCERWTCFGISICLFWLLRLLRKNLFFVLLFLEVLSLNKSDYFGAIDLIYMRKEGALVNNWWWNIDWNWSRFERWRKLKRSRWVIYWAPR